MAQHKTNLFGLVLVFCLIACSLAAASLNNADIHELPEEREFLRSISFQLRPNHNGAVQKRSVDHSTFDSNHSMSISFKALSHEFTALLHHNAELFATDAEVMVYKAEELVESYTPESTAYLGNATIDGQRSAKVSAVVVDYSEGIFHMTITDETNGESYLVEPTYLHPSLSKRRSEDDTQEVLGNMVVFKESMEDVRRRLNNMASNAIERETGGDRCGTTDEQEEGMEVRVSPTTSCPPTIPTTLDMGVVTDNQFTSEAGGAAGARDEAAFIWNMMQSMFVTAVRSKPVIKALIIKTTPTPSPEIISWLKWNSQTCGSDAHKRLESFCVWKALVAHRPNFKSIGLWHLLSGCLPLGGIAGVAYLGTLCTRYNCGISGYRFPSYRGVAAIHEVGHNYGAGHSSNLTSIMLPSVNPDAIGFTPDSISQMCRNTFAIEKHAQCLHRTPDVQPFPPKN